VLVFVIARLIRQPEQASQRYREKGREKSKEQPHRYRSKIRLRGLRWGPVIAALVLSVIAGVLAFEWYTTSLAIPDVPNIVGGIAPFVSQPDVTVTISARLDLLQRPDGADVNINLVIDGHRPGRLIKYAVVFSDDAQLHSFGAEGSSPGPVFANSRYKEKLKVSHIRLAVESGVESDKPAQVLIGVGITNDYGLIITGYDGFMRKPVAAVSGSHRVIVLPAIGFITVPSQLDTPQLQLSLFRLGIPGKWYSPAPKGSITTVDIASESPLSRIDYASPPLGDPAELAWTADGMIRARVSDVAVGTEAKGQRQLFLAGVFAGISSSLLIWFLELGVTAIRRERDSEG
jgi:hypothetical protein